MTVEAFLDGLPWLRFWELRAPKPPPCNGIGCRRSNCRQILHALGVGDRFPHLKRKNQLTIDDGGSISVAPKSDHRGEYYSCGSQREDPFLKVLLQPNVVLLPNFLVVMRFMVSLCRK